MGLLISLAMAVLWLVLAIFALVVLWGLFVTLPLWAIRGARKRIHDTAPTWLLLCGLTVLSALACAIWSPGWGVVILGAGAALLYGRQSYQR
jgi:hypothetical protein